MKATALWLGLLLGLSLLTARASEGHVTYSGGDGSSIDKAIFIMGAKEESEGVKAEYDYLDKHFPNYKLVRQSLLNEKKRSCDLLEITTPDGVGRAIYFDITDYFGKM